MAYQPFVVHIFGPPGSGKSTQAEFVVEEFHAVHVNSGELLRSIINDPRNASDPQIAKEKIKNEAGQLNDSAWVAEIIIGKVREIHEAGRSVVFSGNPRTLSEAEQEAPLFKELYDGRVYALVLDVSEETTMFRNSRRKICSVCGKTVSWSLESQNLLLCPYCSGPLKTRSDDEPSAIRRRLAAYRQRTEPLYKYFASHGIEVIHIDGEQSPDDVFVMVKAELLKRIT